MSTPEQEPDTFESLKKMKMPNFKAFLASKPNNIVSGAISGIGNTVGGALIAVAIMIGSPIKGGMQGYSMAGVKGCAGGVLTGVLIGAVGGVAVAACGALSCIWQVTFGLIRTPAAMVAHFLGQDWDPDTEEFVHYNLSTDSSRTLSFSDESLKAALKEKGTLAAVLRNKTGNALKGSAVAEKERKYVKDTILYDLLDVDPGATQAEIKKAYYVKARQNHPDRNPSDSQAHATFQMIGEAYQVLSDERQRLAYDTRGNAAVKKPTEVDAGAVYAILFGSEAFESIIGELQGATHVKEKRSISSRELGDEDVQLCGGDREVFRERCQAEAEELAGSPMGGALLDLVGGIYKDRSRSESSSLDAYGIALRQSGEAISDLFSVTVDLSGMVLGALEVSKLCQQSQHLSSLEDDRLGVPQAERDAKSANDFLRIFRADSGADPTLRPRVKTLSGKLLAVTWQVLKGDVQSTLLGVCNKVLHDRSVTKEVLAKRREALFILGSEYCSRSATVDLGLSDLVDRVGLQTGLYGPPGPQTDVAGEGDEDDQPREDDGAEKEHSERFNARDFDDKEDFSQNAGKSSADISSDKYYTGATSEYESLQGVLDNLHTFSVKELREKIIYYAGKRSDINVSKFLEKGEMKKCVKGLILSKLTIEDLRSILTNELKAHNINDENGKPTSYVTFKEVIVDCDRVTIINILLNADR